MGATDVVVVTHGDSRAEVHLHGATLTSWTIGGKEQLFLSSKAVLDGSKAIRGGIPLVFPHFGKVATSKLPQHGFARNSKWRVLEHPTDDIVVLELIPELVPSELAALWPHKFRLQYTISLGSSTLTTKLDVYNTEDVRFTPTVGTPRTEAAAKEGKAWDFTVLFHTYFRIADITKTSIQGLVGLTFSEPINNITDATEDRTDVEIAKEVDRTYADVKLPLVITSPQGQVTLTKSSGFSDVVVWNPWIEKSKQMADFGDDEYKEMLCVEIGSVKDFITLGPGEMWSGSQTLAAKL